MPVSDSAPNRDPNSKPDPASRPPLPDLYMPAMPPLGLIAALESRFRAWRGRQRLRQLLDCDDHLLMDLGYSRHDLLWALRLPATHNPLEALQARQRSHCSRPG